MKSKLFNILIGKPFKILMALVVVYFLAAYFAVNPLAQRLLPWVAEHKLASRITVGSVKFDPLRWIITVDHLRLTRPNGEALAGFDRLSLDLEASGMWHLAWHLKDIRLTAPQATVDIAPDGKLNWAELIAKLNEDPQPDANMTRVVIDHLLIEGGNVLYTERNRPVPIKVALQPLGIELDGLSTLPEDRGEYLIAAKLPEQGGTLKWKGDLAVNPLASKGKVDIAGIKLAKLMQVLDQKQIPLKLNTGELQTAFSYQFEMVKGSPDPLPQAKISQIAIKLENMAGRYAETEVGLAEATVTLPALNFYMQHGAQIQFKGLDLALQQLVLKQANQVVFKLVHAGITGVDFDSSAGQANVATVALKALALTQGGDALLNLGKAEVAGIELGLSARQLRVNHVALDAGVLHANRAADGRINWQQVLPVDAQPDHAESVSVKEAAKPFGFDIRKVALQHWQAGVSDQTFVHPLNAAVHDINLDFSVTNTDGALSINDLNSEFSALSVTSGASLQSVVSLAKMRLQHGVLSLKDSLVKLPVITLSGLQAEVVREANKQINLQSVLEQVPAHAEAQTAKSNQPSVWKVSLDKLALEDGRVHVEDKSTQVPVMLDMEHANFELRDASLDFKKPLPVKAAFQIKQGGQFETAGKLTLSPFHADLQLKLDALSLKPYSPYLNQQAYLKLVEGLANVHGKLVIAAAPVLSGQFLGGFGVNSLAINEEAGTSPFLAWKSVSTESLKLGIAPNRLHMDELRIVEPDGEFIINADKTLNVKRILRNQDVVVAAPTATSAQPSSDFPIDIERVSIMNGSLEFADYSLKPQFGTHINALSGVINGLSSQPNSTAQVELDGKVDEYGSARIRGSLQPFHATDFTDLKLAFHNLEMNRLTPYSGKFAGRKIDSGKLTVDLEYKIKQRQLAGENKFVINKLRLGERVDSADATNLPLDLAIALLEDSDGLIDLDLPISGSLDDPQFSYGKIIWKAFVNVLGKIVTSPFHFLGKILGISSDKLSAVGFEPGQSALAPEEQEKLKSIAGALAQRTTLTLNIAPAYDPAADKPALQEQAVRREVMNELGLKLNEGEQAGPVDLANSKVQSALENLLKDRKGEARNFKAVDKLKDLFKKSKPEDAPKYANMLEQLKSSANVTDADLIALAKARATNLQNYLMQTAGIQAQRITVAEVTKVTGDGKTVALKMELGVIKSGNEN